MEFFNPNANINFMAIRRFTLAAAAILIIGSFAAIFTKGLNFGLDFTGGVLVEVNYDEPIEQGEVSAVLEAAGYRGAIVQRFSSTNLSIRLSPEQVEEGSSRAEREGSLDDRSSRVGEMVLAALRADGRKVEIQRSEFVGPQVGRELAYNGIVAVLVVLTGIMIYIGMRFEWRFAVATIAGELHDVIVVLGFFAVTGMDFDLAVLAAILAVDGYSVNDKIVIFDRVRELFRSTRKADTVDILNKAVNTTLSRTIMTSVTTLLTIVALFLLGGQTLQGFSTALIVGIVVGTLSSIFFSCPLLMALGVSKADLMPKARDEAELARRP